MKPGRILALIVSIALIAYLAYTLDLSAIVAQFAKLEPTYAAGALALSLLNLLTGTARLASLVKYIGRFSINYLDLLRANVAGLVSSLVVPNLIGSMVGRYVLLRRNGLTIGDIASLVTVERLLLVLVGGSLLVVGWAAVIGLDTLSVIIRQLALLEILCAFVLTVVLLLSVFSWKRELALVKSIVSVRSLGRTAWLILLTLIGQGLMLVVYLFCAKAMGAVDVDPWKLMAVAAIVSFAAGLPFSVNGWGVREVAAIFAFQHVGIDAPEAVAISVLVGLISTLIVLAAAPSLLLNKRQDGVEDVDEESLANVSNGGADRSRWRLLLTATLGVGFLIFVTIHVPIEDTLITMNFGDPFAILAFVLCLVSWLGTRRMPFTVPARFALWIAAITAVIALGFVIGASRIGVTDWALNNRFLGWGVILGYIALGAMIVTTLGRHGLRQLCEVILASGAAVVWFFLIYPRLGNLFGNPTDFASNFHGFSSNRNTFVFQLLIALSGALAYSRVLAKRENTWWFCFLTGSVMFGIFRTYSLAGLGTGVVILAAVYLANLVDRRVILRSIAVAVLLWVAIQIDAYLIDWSILPTRNFSSLTEASLGNNSLVERVLSVTSGLALWQEYPLFGAGLGAFVELNLGERGQALVIHSVYGWLLAEFGLVGLITVGSLPMAVIYTGVKSRKLWSSPQAVLLIASGMAFLIFSAVHDIAYQRLFWFVIGAIAAAYGLTGREKQVRK